MSLTKEEIEFLNKIEREKAKHRESQAKYRAKHKEEEKEYNKEYYKKKKDKIDSILKKVPPPPPTPINVKEIINPPKIDKRTRRGKKQTTSVDITPSYQKRKEPLEESTIDQYISSANVLQKLFKNKVLSQKAKGEIKKLLNDNDDIDEKFLLDEMDYINNNIEKTIDKIRDHYTNDNTFRSYLIVLTVITSHLKTLNPQIYQTLTKIAVFMNDTIQGKRKQNKLEEKDEGKVIDLDRTTVLKNIEELNKIDDKLIYSIYTLLPARRLEWRLMKLTTEKNDKKLEDPVNQYLVILPKNNYKIVFNDYKTYKTYGQQVFDIDDIELKQIIHQYISEKGLSSGDYLFPLARDKREVVSQSYFSNKIKDVFFKIYNIPITVRFLRISHVSNLMETNPTEEEKETLAYFMGHSIDEQRKYNKIVKNK